MRKLELYPEGESPFPRRMCGSRGRTCRRTSSAPRGGAVHTQCTSCTPCTATGTFLSWPPAPHSCPNTTDDLTHTHTHTHTHTTIQPYQTTSVYGYIFPLHYTINRAPKCNYVGRLVLHRNFMRTTVQNVSFPPFSTTRIAWRSYFMNISFVSVRVKSIFVSYQGWSV